MKLNLSLISKANKTDVQRVITYYMLHPDAMPWCAARALKVALNVVYEVVRIP